MIQIQVQPQTVKYAQPLSPQQIKAYLQVYQPQLMPLIESLVNSQVQEYIKHKQQPPTGIIGEGRSVPNS